MKNEFSKFIMTCMILLCAFTIRSESSTGQGPEMAGWMIKRLKSGPWDVNNWYLLSSAVFHECNIVDSLHV